MSLVCSAPLQAAQQARAGEAAAPARGGEEAGDAGVDEGAADAGDARSRGFSPGEIDGRMGTNTKQALEAFTNNGGNAAADAAAALDDLHDHRGGRGGAVHAAICRTT